MTVLLVGCGYWGMNWANTLHKLGALGAISESDSAIHEDLRSKYPFTVRVYSDLADALNHPAVEAVVIATPASTHASIARQCLLKDKHLLVEKPMAVSSQEAKELVAIADERELILAAGHLLMYHPALLTLQMLIRDGMLGDILSIHCTRMNLGKIRNEENCWWSLAPHDISILSMLFEEPFEAVSAAKMHILKRPEIEDTVYASFVTKSGRSASINSSWLSPFKKHETVVIGTEKIAVFEDTMPLEKKLMLMDYRMERQNQWVGAVERRDSVYVPLTMSEDLLSMEAKAFLAAIYEGAPLQNDGHNGLQVVMALEQVQKLLNKQTLAISSS